MKFTVWCVFCFTLYLQFASGKKRCVCELKNSEETFPNEKLDSISSAATNCTQSITSIQLQEVDVLVLGLQRRLEQIEQSVSVLEKEDDGDLYGALSLRIIELELAEISELLLKLNNSIRLHHQLSESSSKQLQSMLEEMQKLEVFDHSQVVRKQRENQRIKRELAQCQNELHTTALPPTSTPRHCAQGRLVGVTGPGTYSLTQYGTSYTYGAWGKDPKPAAGKENSYWLVALTSSNVFANFVRQYGSLSTILVGVGPVDASISPSNPTTNTIQGPNVIMYENALYYNCYNSPSVCRFNISDRTVSSMPLPQDTGFNSKFNFGHLGGAYGYTDLDFSTDESGVWVVYTTPENYGNVIVSKVKEGIPPSLGQSWKTSLHKRTVTNTFVVCGVLYATRFVDKDTEEIFYSFDTETAEERYDLKLSIKKMQPNIQSLNYNPRDRMLYMYSDAYILSYSLIFQ